MFAHFIPSKIPGERSYDRNKARVTTCLNFWKRIKLSFKTPAALELYDFLISRATSTFTRVFNTRTRVITCACARACVRVFAGARSNEYVKDCYYSSQYKLGAQDSFADVSIIHAHVSEYGGVGIASQLGEEKEGEEDEAGRGGGIHSVVHYQFVPSCCRNGPLFVTRFQSDKYVLHVALWKRNFCLEWPMFVLHFIFDFHDR